MYFGLRKNSSDESSNLSSRISEFWKHWCHQSDSFLLFSESLHQVLSEFSVIRPIRTNSEGHFLSSSVSVHQRRHTRSTEDNNTNRQTRADKPSLTERVGHSRSGRGYGEEAELFYNVTLFAHELHLRLHPNSRLVAPRATVDWWEESGHKHSQPIEDTDCFYTGEVSNMEDTSVAISNCDGLVRVVFTV